MAARTRRSVTPKTERETTAALAFAQQQPSRAGGRGPPLPLKRARASATLHCCNRRDPAVPTAALEPATGISGVMPPALRGAEPMHVSTRVLADAVLARRLERRSWTLRSSDPERPRAALETLGLSELPTDDIAEVATSRPVRSA